MSDNVFKSEFLHGEKILWMGLLLIIAFASYYYWQKSKQRDFVWFLGLALAAIPMEALDYTAKMNVLPSWLSFPYHIFSSVFYFAMFIVLIKILFFKKKINGRV